MIQSPALIPATLLALPGERAPAVNGDVAPSTDFGALLAIPVTPSNPSAELDAPVLVAQSPVADRGAEPANAASSGSHLPPALPPALSPAASSTAEPADVTDEVDPDQTAPVEAAAVAKPTQPNPKSAKIARSTALRSKDPQNASEPRGPATPPARELAKLEHRTTIQNHRPSPVGRGWEWGFDAGVVPPPQPLATGEGLKGASPTQNAFVTEQNGSSVDPIVAWTEVQMTMVPVPPIAEQPLTPAKLQAQPAFEHAAPQAAFLRVAAAPGEPQPALDQPAPQPATPAPIRPLRIEIELPGQVASAIRAARPVALRQLARIAPAGLGAPVFAANSPAPPALIQSAPQPAQLERPQDFTALLDRLVAAREAAMPQRVSITLSHAEFGPVHLRFRQEAGAVAVAMTSADSEFARAASLAAPPVMPVAESRAAPGSATHSDSSQNASSTGPGQHRGQSAERRAEQVPGTNPSPRAGGPAKPDRRHGIFA